VRFVAGSLRFSTASVKNAPGPNIARHDPGGGGERRQMGGKPMRSRGIATLACSLVAFGAGHPFASGVVNDAQKVRRS
jgi:hypothetical protein